jgi:hypothetical protein
MVAELTGDQLTLLRADLGDTATPSAFSDTELQMLWDLAEESHARTVLWGFDQLLASAVRFTDYTQNETQEKKSQIRDGLFKLRAIWQSRVADEAATAGTLPRTTVMTRLRPIWRTKGSPNA